MSIAVKNNKMNSRILIFKQSNIRSYYFNFDNNLIERFENNKPVGQRTIYQHLQMERFSFNDIGRGYKLAFEKIKKCLIRKKIMSPT